MTLPSATEISTALHGAIRLAQLDAGGLKFFDRSSGGFWRSFFAAIMIAPAHLILLYWSQELPGSAGVLRTTAVELISYAMRWLAYPFAMLFVLDFLGRRERYFDYLVPYNWVNIPQVGLLLFVTGLRVLGLLPTMLSDFLSLIAFVSILIYQWFVARVGLRISGTAAIALVLLDLVLGLSIGWVTEYLLRA